MLICARYLPSEILMPLSLASRADLTLANFRRVAWQGEAARFAPAALARMTDSRRQFLDLLDSDPELTIYGVTSGYGQHARKRLSAGRAQAPMRAVRPMARPSPSARRLPERVVRGHRLRATGQLRRGPCRRLGRAGRRGGYHAGGRALAQGQPGGPGRGRRDHRPWRRLFNDLAERIRARREGGAVADQRLAVPPPRCSPMRRAAGGAGSSWPRRSSPFRPRRSGRPSAISPRSWRSSGAMRPRPRRLARAAELMAGGDPRAAALSGARQLSHPAPRAGAVPPGGARRRRPRPKPRSRRSPTIRSSWRRARAIRKARVYSTGGYHNAMAHPAMDNLAAAMADLCLLADRHTRSCSMATIRCCPTSCRRAMAISAASAWSRWAMPSRRAGRRSAISCRAARAAASARTTSHRRPSSPGGRRRKPASCLEAALAMLAAVGLAGAVRHRPFGSAGPGSPGRRTRAATCRR